MHLSQALRFLKRDSFFAAVSGDGVYSVTVRAAGEHLPYALAKYGDPFGDYRTTDEVVATFFQWEDREGWRVVDCQDLPYEKALTVVD